MHPNAPPKFCKNVSLKDFGDKKTTVLVGFFVAGRGGAAVKAGVEEVVLCNVQECVEQGGKHMRRNIRDGDDVVLVGGALAYQRANQLNGRRCGLTFFYKLL